MTPEEPDLTKDIVERREFTLADFIAQEGADFLKGESPVPKLVQVVTEIKQLMVDEELSKVSQNLDTPVGALELIVEEILDNQELLYELVHRVDVKWGQIYGERPYFQQPNQKPHPEDEYTHTSVRDKLVIFLATVKQNNYQ
jgi:hypothetical protein